MITFHLTVALLAFTLGTANLILVWPPPRGASSGVTPRNTFDARRSILLGVHTHA